MHSVRKTHWGDRDFGGIKGVMRRPGYDLKIVGDTRGIPMKINQRKDSVGEPRKFAGERGRSKQSLNTQTKHENAISLRKYTLKLNWGRLDFNTIVQEIYYLLPVTG